MSDLSQLCANTAKRLECVRLAGVLASSLVMGSKMGASSAHSKRWRESPP